jgi:hypothetical protein
MGAVSTESSVGGARSSNSLGGRFRRQSGLRSGLERNCTRYEPERRTPSSDCWQVCFGQQLLRQERFCARPQIDSTHKLFS